MSLDLRQLIRKLEPSCRSSLEAGAGLALTNGHRSVELVHWLLKLIEAGGPLAGEIGAAMAPATLSAELTRAMDRLPRGAGGPPSLSPTLVNWMREAWLAASLEFGRDAVGELDLLYALLTEPILASVAFDLAPRLRQVNGQRVATAASGWDSPDAPAPSNGDAPTSEPGAAPVPGGEEGLARFTVDLTALARAGKIDPIVGRDGEIRQVIDILSRRRQNNPILVGEAGVGKTAIVEGFAMRIAAGDVPPPLRNVVVRTLDLALLQAGAGAKGEFEQRLKSVIAAVKASPVPVILFIDEAHTLVGAGGQAGQGDAANLIKPALARGELRTIAATTWAEYKKYFERDAALTRRFQTVKVDEPEHAVAVAMMRALVPVLEKHHGVRILEEALHDAVRLSSRYIPARQLPDKCVSLLDTAAASVAIARTTPPAPVEDASRLIERLDAEHAALEREGATDKLPAIARERAELAAERDALHARWQAELALVREIDAAEASGAGMDDLKLRLEAMQGDEPLVPRLVGRDAVAGVVTRWTGIPVGRMLRDDVASVLGLEQALRRRVIGQDHAITVIADAMQVGRAHLADPRKPVGVFLLVGTSGVGKTETAVALAEQLYGGAQSLTVVNLSEFKEEHKVSMLVGSPPGYVGYGEGGVLTEAVRRRPHGVLLLDEVEKAHPGVQDVFYQVFDKGSLRDGEGRDIDFRNTTIILTANVGSDLLQALAADPETMPEPAALEALLRPELLKVFKPAFLGRVVVVPYMPLSDETLSRIVGLQLDKVRNRAMEMHGVPVTFDPALVADVTARARNTEIGARAVEQIVARELLPLLSRFFLERIGERAMPTSVTVAVDSTGRFAIQPRWREDGVDGGQSGGAGELADLADTGAFTGGL